MKYILMATMVTSLLIIVVGGLSLKNKGQTKNSFVNISLPTQPVALAASETSLDSPDGKDTLNLKITLGKDFDTYFFSTKSGFTYTKTESKADSISIPYNSWSPDYKYVFLTESENSIKNYYVLSVLNKLFANDTKYLNITDAFDKKLSNYKLKEVTGWASPTLLIVNTDTEKGAQGPSFWYDITTQSFIQLSTRFN